MPDDEKLAAVREALPATGAGIYLNTGSAGPLPAETVRAMREIEDWELRVGRASPDDWDTVFERMDEARGVVAALLHGSPEAVALTHSTMSGIHLALSAPDWRRGDRAVTSNVEYPGVVEALREICRRFGAELEIVDAIGKRDEVLNRFERAVDERTRLVVVSHVSYSTGQVLPVADIGDLAGRVGAWYVVDGAQSAGAIGTDVESTGADFYAIPAQKWLLGPEGMGALWAGPRAVAEAAESGGGAVLTQELGRSGAASSKSESDARRFDASTLHHPSIVGLARSVGWLEMYVGLEWAFDRAARLTRLAHDRLSALDGVQVLTPVADLATLIAFRVSGWTAEQAREELARRVFAITRAIPELDAVRVSVGFFNTDEEVARFVQTVELLTQHTPETIPRRPALVVVPASPAREGQ
jgi:L-cysteine/cystine lyase